MAMTPAFSMSTSIFDTDLGRRLGSDLTASNQPGPRRRLILCGPCVFRFHSRPAGAASVRAVAADVGAGPLAGRGRLREPEAREFAPVMSTVRPASEPGAGAKTSSVFAKACVGCAVTLASTKIVPWCGALRRRREASVALYAIDAKHLLRHRRRDDRGVALDAVDRVVAHRASTKNRAQFEGTHATLATHRQRRPQRDARRREPTDAAA